MDEATKTSDILQQVYNRTFVLPEDPESLSDFIKFLRDESFKINDPRKLRLLLKYAKKARRKSPIIKKKLIA